MGGEGGEEGGGKGAKEKEKVEIWQTFRGNEWENKGEKVGEGVGTCRVDVKVVGAKGFYEERGGCEFLGFLVPPLVLDYTTLRYATGLLGGAVLTQTNST